MADLTSEISKQFKDYTNERKLLIMKSWIQKTQNWLVNAKNYVNSTEKLRENVSKFTKKHINEIEEMFKDNERVEQQISGNIAIMESGYRLLNEIGETIRGEKIIYSVTYTTTGKRIGAKDAGDVYTVEVGLEEFLKMVNFSSRRMTLKKSSTLAKMMKAQSDIKEKKWEPEKIKSFNLYRSQIRGKNNWNWQKVNDGNILEAFIRFQTSGNSVQKTKKHSYWESLYWSMFNTMKAPDIFFAAGDIKNKQIKGLSASVTNINTLIVNINIVLKILMSNSEVNSAIEERFKKNNNLEKKIEEVKNKTIDEVVKELVDMFTSSVSR